MQNTNASTVRKTGETAIKPAGEIAERINLTAKRLASAGFPRFSDEFILADVTLDKRRRFYNFSGDLSGRWVGALACLPSVEADIKRIVEAILAEQKPDGRFGDQNLSFQAEDIADQQMALLWGNGRLLAGLMEYYEREKDERVLKAAEKLGEFLTKVEKDCTAPEVINRLEGQGAFGFICFTQLAEGLVLLAKHTGGDEFLETVKHIFPLLPPRGIQHSHGYLSTLRGVMMLYEETGEKEFLEFVETRFQDLIGSPDYVIYGSPLEYFGWDIPEVTDEERGILILHSGADPRSEGCSEADFLRLCLQLWQATENLEYLDRAERCLVNSFYYNQFETGDFGHHATFEQGLKPTESVGRAWWCCTMHGYRAFPDVLQAIIGEDENLLRVNLFLDAEIENENYRLVLKNTAEGFEIKAEEIKKDDLKIAVRLPDWAETEIAVGGEKAEFENQDGYAVLPNKLKSGDQISLKFDYKTKFVARDGKELEISDLTETFVEAAVFHGAYLLGVDEKREPMFFGEPWQSNVIFADTVQKAENIETNETLSNPKTHLTFEYAHGGFAETERITLRPIAEQTPHGQGIVAVWLNFAKKEI